MFGGRVVRNLALVAAFVLAGVALAQEVPDPPAGKDECLDEQEIAATPDAVLLTSGAVLRGVLEPRARGDRGVTIRLPSGVHRFVPYTEIAGLREAPRPPSPTALAEETPPVEPARGDCPACAKRGRFTCHVCDGEKASPCAACAGQGSWTELRPEVGALGPVEFTRATVDCPMCPATGQIPCRECRGRGWFPCAMCDGRGTFRPEPPAGRGPGQGPSSKPPR